jgi:hypothetical protein
VPQLSTSILHELMRDLRKYGWAGFVVRERFPGDHDSALAYLARAAWDTSATPKKVIADQIGTICGPECVEDMSIVFSTVEEVTALLEKECPFFSFPLPRLIMMFWDGVCFSNWDGTVIPKYDDGGPLLGYVDEAITKYHRALEAAQRAKGKISVKTAAAQEYTNYWIGRLEFALDYMEMAQTLRRAARAEAAKDRPGAIREMKQAIDWVVRGLEAYAGVVRNPTDLGTIALINEHGYRALKAKLAELEAKG